MALLYLHSGRMALDDQPAPGWDAMIHLDMKPNNIFVSSRPGANKSGWPRIVLGDFGCAVFQSDIARRNVRGEVMGAPGWVSPECEAGGYARASPASDIWQLAGICQALAKFVSRPHFGMGGGFPLGGNYSLPLNEGVVMMSRMNPHNRPSAREILTELRRRKRYV